MRFYTKQHRYYCGIDQHARTMYLCVLDHDGEIVLHRNMPCGPHFFLKAIAPCREDTAVAVECIFTWYWLADLCAKENIPFVLGQALCMKAIHGGKAKTDNIAALLRGVAEHFPDPSVRKSVEMDLTLIDHYDRLLTDVELYITRSAKVHDVDAFHRLRSVPGIGKILALVILYEIHDIGRFPTVQDVVS